MWRSSRPLLSALRLTSQRHGCGCISAKSSGVTTQQQSCGFAAEAAATAEVASAESQGSSTQEPLVPEGQKNNDLSDAACHIGLQRRRDITLRDDLRLHNTEQALRLREIFTNFKAVLVGFPGGKVCQEKHIPGYIQQTEELSSKGVDKLVFVTVCDDPAKLLQWTENLKPTSQPKVEFYADKNCGFMRMLGLDLTGLDVDPKCQRFAAIVEDGILLKLKVEQKPSSVQVSDCKSIMKLWSSVYERQ